MSEAEQLTLLLVLGAVTLVASTEPQLCEARPDPGVGSLMDRVIQMKDGRIVGQQARDSGEANTET